ncbi:Rv1733c family protein [Actinomadura chibensis]|uniref:Uncharacterized protein n=1 Tax=Actinomadura chibensis TaxID=392828 RepID=A0A5D0NHJ3_9ACTN|nr:hypothetical protein [Actinomadura chibensis]TYB43916.1 hypothetical protein FXF69_23380 [Actinomadura chibensis]
MKSPKWWSRVDRWRRRCGFDDNDLRRPVDRVQWLSGLFLLVVFLAVTPALCVQAVHHARDAGARAERYEATARHRVDATVVKVRRLQSGREVTVIWIDRDGTLRTGRYVTWHGVESGDHPRVWAGPRHRVSDSPPQSHARTVVEVVVTATATAVAAGLSALGLYLLLRRRLDRRRYRAWDRAWDRFDQRRHRPA